MKSWKLPHLASDKKEKLVGTLKEIIFYCINESGFIVDDSYHSWRMKVESVWKDDLHVQLQDLDRGTAVDNKMWGKRE